MELQTYNTFKPKIFKRIEFAMVLLEIPDLLFEKLMSDIDNFTNRVTVIARFDEGLRLVSDDEYLLKLVDNDVVEAFEQLKNTDHMLLQKQFKLLADLGDLKDLDKSIEIEQLTGIEGLLGVIHDLIHANDPNIPDPDDGCLKLLDS